ncbi:hypothetical protein [Paenibacillus sp. PAMC 26794]|uniref:hypothetical protein n=1 Tax=Paenibacillus sp. PAMC 26794 TaxID=1257080 RepID=UPI0003012612|nr:hypothetical protein [Paenibacillus sp. PAMC 26794]
MVTMEPIVVGEHVLVGVEVKLPKTTLLTTNTSKGYIMCGATTVSHFGLEYETYWYTSWTHMGQAFISFHKCLKGLEKSSKSSFVIQFCDV